MPSLAGHSMWQVRMYAARAAAALNDGDRLVAFVRDSNANVREAALDGLSRVRRHEADSIYISALSAREYQVVLAAVRGLAGTAQREAAIPALVAALARISAERRETSRDVRMAILLRLRELGSSASAPSLMTYLTDFDPAIADSAASILSRWTGQPQRAFPRPLPRADQPLDDPSALRNVRIRFTMAQSAGGGQFEITLYAEETPATAARILRLARAGYYNGLTFHRIVANFVIQGGSPAANEYVGDGPYMRDELGLLSNERGTLGISTRGRDLGDAQVYVNTVDNPRLDFDYTVFARVVTGMATVDGILEGDVIAKVEVVGG
jgi:cyclophilin family peptidyl-prolyl cis-trans isomerase